MKLVVAAAIVDNLRNPSWLLCAQRSEPPAARGRWEFPGGKIEPNETPEQAIHREIMEELGIEVKLGQQIPAGHEIIQRTPAGDWPLGGDKFMRVWLAEITKGKPTILADHLALEWRAIDDVDTLPWLGPDRPILDAVVSAAGWYRIF